MVGLTPARKKRTVALSGGQRRRLDVAGHRATLT